MTIVFILQASRKIQSETLPNDRGCFLLVCAVVKYRSKISQANRFLHVAFPGGILCMVRGMGRIRQAQEICNGGMTGRRSSAGEDPVSRRMLFLEHGDLEFMKSAWNPLLRWAAA
jgi:hypothetical protein